VNNKTFKKIGLSHGKKAGEIFFDAHLYPSIAPLPLYCVRRNLSENGRFRLVEADFSNKKKPLKLVSIETKKLLE
jgi:hypothetical protein